VTSRICTTNNRFKRSKNKLCFSENFCWQTKNIHNFLGDNTRFTPGIEAWSRETQKMGFRMDTKKKFRKEKGMTLYWPPVPTSRGTNQPKRYYRGREPIKPRINCFKRSLLQCEVLHSTMMRSVRFQHEGREIDPHHVRETDNDRLIILVESLFQFD